MWRFLLIMLLLAACQPEPPDRSPGLSAVTPVPTLDETNPAALCDAVDANWGRDWTQVIRALQTLEMLDADCGVSLDARLYAAHIGYGTLLEQRGRREEAIQAYQDALIYNFNGTEAIRRLQRLEVFTVEPPPACEPRVIEGTLETMPEYIPVGEGAFVGVEGRDLVVDGQPYPVYGVNYYPRDYPEGRFLTEMDVESVEFELDLMRASGINTLRLLLRHDDLFTCPGNGAIPVPVNFARLDGLIQLAAAYEYRVILVLNIEADLFAYPLYNSPDHIMQQMAYIAGRYRDEPTVMAYDLRQSGDQDYALPEGRFQREIVLSWLSEAAAVVRNAAPDQLITAGWNDDSAVTAPIVDFVSFQHFGNVDSLRQEIALLTDATTRPILLAAVGYNTFDLDELGQRQAYQRAFEAAERTGLAGWVAWAAFDYPLSVLCEEPNCPAEDGPDNRYGLWGTTYFPKLAVDAVRQAVGVSD